MSAKFEGIHADFILDNTKAPTGAKRRRSDDDDDKLPRPQRRRPGRAAAKGKSFCRAFAATNH
jgi:hypothetical protein